MSEKLKPCPLCGCEDIRYKVHQDHLGNWHGSIYCREHYNKKNDDDRCWSMFYARSPNSREEVIEKLIKKWNKRSNPWHTGTPTEEGWYLVKYICIHEGKYKGNIWYSTFRIELHEDGYIETSGGIGSDDVWHPVEYLRIGDVWKSKETD